MHLLEFVKVLHQAKSPTAPFLPSVCTNPICNTRGHCSCSGRTSSTLQEVTVGYLRKVRQMICIKGGDKVSCGQRPGYPPSKSSFPDTTGISRNSRSCPMLPWTMVVVDLFPVSWWGWQVLCSGSFCSSSIFLSSFLYFWWCFWALGLKMALFQAAVSAVAVLVPCFKAFLPALSWRRSNPYGQKTTICKSLL